jgi:hypothetical protein
MRRVIIPALAVVALSCVIATAAVGAKPPSFALWAAQERLHEDSLINPVTNGCTRRFAHDDAKAGQCVAKGLSAVYPKLAAWWERGVARIAPGQPAACREAIRVYVRAGRKSFAAGTRYFKSHQHSSSTQIQGDLHGEPFATLASVRDRTRSGAIRICH